MFKPQQCLIRVEVEDGLATRTPAAAVEEENSGRVTQVADGREALHVGAGNRLELNGHAYERSQLSRSQVARKDGVRLPFHRFPAQPARLAGGGGSLEESCFQRSALAVEFVHG